MEVLTKVREFGEDLFLPFGVVPLEKVGLGFTLIGLYEAAVLHVSKHLQVNSTLYFFIVPHSIEEAICTVLDLHKGSRSVLIHLDTVKPTHNLVQGSLNDTDVILVEGIVLMEVRSHLVILSRLLFVPCSVIGVKSLANVIFGLNHLLWEEARMLNLMEQLPCLLLNIYGGLTFEVFGVRQDLLGTLKGIEHKESFFLLGFTLKGLGTVFLPQLTHKFLGLLETTTNSRGNIRGLNDYFLDGKGLERTLTLTKKVGIHHTTRNSISETIVCVIKLLAEDILVQVCEFYRTHKTFLVHLKGTLEYKILRLCVGYSIA